MGWNDEEEPDWFAESADRALGTAVDVLDTRGDGETAGLLAFSDLRYKYRDWKPPAKEYAGILYVEPALLDFFTDERCQVVLAVLQAIHRGDYDNRIVEVVAAARLVEDDWRAERRMRHSNQVAGTSSLAPTGPTLPPPRDGAEVKVFNAFRTARSNMPPHDSLVISMNVRLQLPNGRNVEVDTLVVRRGRMAVVEIDGDTHRRSNRYAADASRDQFLRDAGIHIERVVAEDMNKAEEVQALVGKVLARLAD